MQSESGPRKRIAVVGSGISGMSAAWLLSQKHDVTVYERKGGWAAIPIPSSSGMPTATSRSTPASSSTTRQTYPNLTALFDHLGVPTQPSEMSFAVSLDGGALEYSGSAPATAVRAARNLFRPRFWSMLRDLLALLPRGARDMRGARQQSRWANISTRGGYGDAFRDDHLLPMAAAIWSAPPGRCCDYPAAAFIRFYDNHGLLQIDDRPQWRTVAGGSRAYVDKLDRPDGRPHPAGPGACVGSARRRRASMCATRDGRAPSASTTS